MLITRFTEIKVISEYYYSLITSRFLVGGDIKLFSLIGTFRHKLKL